MSINFIHRLAKLETKVETIESNQSVMGKDIKEILETVNKSKGGFWAVWTFLSLSSGAALFSLASIIGID